MEAAMTDSDKLEHRINSGLTNGAATSATITELITKTEAAIEEAAATAEQEHAKALDMGCSDPATAEASARAAELKRDRLVPVVARLQDNQRLSPPSGTRNGSLNTAASRRSTIP
jgi:hypothetical protein